jgi:hypothetical protein
MRGRREAVPGTSRGRIGLPPRAPWTAAPHPVRGVRRRHRADGARLPRGRRGRGVRRPPDVRFRSAEVAGYVAAHRRSDRLTYHREDTWRP